MIEVEGPFNEEGLEYWFSELQQSVSNRSSKNWRRLEIWNDDALASPESLNIGKSIYDWYENNGCIQTAIVVSNSLQQQIIEDIFKSSAKVFRDKKTAKKWLDKI